MGRGVSSGGGQSSLGYLFGGGEPPSQQRPAMIHLLKISPWLQVMNPPQSQLFLPHKLMASRSLLGSIQMLPTTISEQMARTVGTFLQIDLQQRSMQHQVVDLLLGISLVAAATEAVSQGYYYHGCTRFTAKKKSLFQFEFTLVTSLILQEESTQ